MKCFNVPIINDGVCGDDAGHYFTLKLSTYSPLVLVSPESTKVYIYDAVDCSEFQNNVLFKIIITSEVITCYSIG